MRKIGAIAVIAGLFLTSTMVWAVSKPSEKKETVKQTKATSSITWNKYDEAFKLAAKSKKPIMIDFYTNWCGFCKRMDQQTYIDPTIVEYINEHFVPVKLNAESRETLNLPDGPTNGVSIARSFGVRAYPQTWFVEADGTKMGGRPGYMPPQLFIYFLKYYGDGHYKNSSFEDYYTKVTSAKE